MNLEKIGILIRLRYKLLWAKTRTRNGKIAWFFAGYLLLVAVAGIFAAGGVGAGITAVRSGQGTLLAGTLLSVIFFQAMMASVVLGFGMTVIFSETELRRFPLNALERRVTRHFIGVVDPFWFLFMALDLGLALGLYLVGAGSFWLGLVAALLLFVSNYVAARVLGMLVDRLTAKKGGSLILMVMLMSLGLLPATLQGHIHKSSPIVGVIKQIWHFTPTAGAAAAMTHTDSSAFSGLGLVLLWMAAFTAVLVALERRPVKVAVSQSMKVTWEGRMDKVGALFGPKTGPLVANWLRFYSRNNRFRAIYPLALPLVAFLVLVYGKQTHASNPLANAIAGFGVLGFVGTGQFAVNQFGYVGGGFRRFLLLPTDPAAAFRAGSYMFVMLSSLLIVVASLAWPAVAPMPNTAQVQAMVTGAAVFSLFLFHGAALWTSLLGPRRGNYNMSFGNDLSFLGNIVVIGGMLVMLFLPRVIDKVWPAAISPDKWWCIVALAAAAAMFYFSSLKATTALFLARREQLMMVMEGKG